MLDLSELARDLTVGPAARALGVTVLPLFAPAPARPLTYRLGSEAMAARQLEVHELGAVDKLEARNRSSEPVLFLEGDHLTGAKQNRVVTSTALVGARRKVTLPVSCVEQGRWSGESSQFDATSTVAPASVRRILKLSVTRSLVERACRVADQEQVWSQITSAQSRLGVSSRTRSLAHSFLERAPDVGAIAAQLPWVAGARGLAIAIGGELASIDLFDQASTCRHYWKQLVEGAALESLGRGAGLEVSAPQVRELLDRLLGPSSAAAWVRVPAVGDGEEARVQVTGATASALGLDGQIVHLGVARGTVVGSRGNAVRRDLPEALAARYRIVSRIGVGGAKEVFRATDLRTGGDVAIARIPGVVREDLAHEVELAARIQGDGSPRIFESFIDDFEDGYMVMEYCAGPSLAQLAARPLAVDEAAPILLALARSVRAIHDAHVLHRDLKLENALLCSTDAGVRLKILDFGISARARSASTSAGVLPMRGTLPYMAREMVMGQGLDARSDVFALGVCCFRMLTGEFPVPPTDVESEYEYLLRLRDVTRHDLSRLPPMPAEATAILARMLEVERERRPFMPEVVAAFERAFGDRPLTMPGERGRPAMAARAESPSLRAAPLGRAASLVQQVAVSIAEPEHLLVAPCAHAPLVALQPGIATTMVRAFGPDGRERWSRCLDGRLVAGLRADLDGDGVRELYLAGPDRLAALDARGELRYSRAVAAGAPPTLIAIPDPRMPRLMLDGRLREPRTGDELGRLLYAYQGDGRQLVEAVELTGLSYNGRALQGFRGGRGTGVAIVQHPGRDHFLVAHLETSGHRVQLVVYGPGGHRLHLLPVATGEVPTGDPAEIARLVASPLFGPAHAPLALLGGNDRAVVVVPLLGADPALPSTLAAFSLPGGHELWRVHVAAAAARALFADLDGDGLPELIVGTGRTLTSYQPWTGATTSSSSCRGLPVAFGDPFGTGFAHLITASHEGVELRRGPACQPHTMRWSGPRGDLWRTGTMTLDGTALGPS